MGERWDRDMSWHSSNHCMKNDSDLHCVLRSLCSDILK